jgi:hypothetical protein
MSTATLPTIRREDMALLEHEIEAYLTAVEAFRAEGAEPDWADDEALPDWWRAEWRPDPT